MKKKILIFVNTEYHLLLATNQILGVYNNSELFDIELYVRKGGRKRLTQPLDFSALPAIVQFFDEEVTINKDLSQSARIEIENLFKGTPDTFIFFQEMDPLMVILAEHYAKNGTEIFLFQDGLKPYVHLKFHSLGLLKHFHRQNLWLKKNGFPVESWFSPILAKKYAHLKKVSKIFLTFPEAYENWNHKPIEKITFLPLKILNPLLKKLFIWDDSLLPERENIILFLNQPLHDDGKAEIKVLRQIEQVFPNASIYLKLHPLTDDKKLEQYKNLRNVKLIKSEIPAELFIMNLKKSIIISINSTSMLLNNPENKFYYLNDNLFEEKIKRLKRYKLKKVPGDHIVRIDSIKEIIF